VQFFDAAGIVINLALEHMWWQHPVCPKQVTDAVLLPALVMLCVQALLRKYLPLAVVIGVVLLVLLFRKLLF
jgi:hypothetical protein